jgi:hypothetical protein
VFRVAGLGLEGGQVAVLRLHAASTGHVTTGAYSCMREMYRLQSTKEAPNFGESVTAKFAEFELAEVHLQHPV